MSPTADVEGPPTVATAGDSETDLTLTESLSLGATTFLSLTLGAVGFLLVDEEEVAVAMEGARPGTLALDLCWFAAVVYALTSS